MVELMIRVLQIGDTVIDINTHVHYNVESFDAPEGCIEAYPFLDTKVIFGEPPTILQIKDLLYETSSGKRKRCTLPGQQETDDADDDDEFGAAAALTALRDAVPLVPPQDMKYNWRKATINEFLCKQYSDYIGPMDEARALILDDFPRGVDDAPPSTTSALLRRGVKPSNIVLVNHMNTQVLELARSMGVDNAWSISLKDYVENTYPLQPFGLLYLDACGIYHVQVRDALCTLLRFHHLWLRDVALLVVTGCKRDPNGGREVLFDDLREHCREFGTFFEIPLPEFSPTSLMWCVAVQVMRRRAYRSYLV